MKYFISAGEASGDIHASRLIRAIKELDSGADIRFLGGDLMAREAGRKPAIHYRDMAYMGFVDVALNITKVLGNLQAARDGIEQWHPDRVILVDYPSFNLRLAETAADLGIPVDYYIPPKVWAWKEGRVRKMKELIRNIYCIFPFEVGFYKKYGMDVSYVGNPSVGEIDSRLAKLPPAEVFRAENGLGDKPLIALLPGSRVSEIKKNLPTMLKGVSYYPKFTPVIAASPGVDKELYESIAPDILRVEGKTFDLVAHSVAAVVTSGTATLEAALIGTPQVATYQAVKSRIVYAFFKNILNVKYVTLPNIIMDRRVIPELLLHLCTPTAVARELVKILPGGSERAGMLENYKLLREKLGTADAAMNAARMIVR